MNISFIDVNSNEYKNYIKRCRDIIKLEDLNNFLAKNYGSIENFKNRNNFDNQDSQVNNAIISDYIRNLKSIDIKKDAFKNASTNAIKEKAKKIPLVKTNKPKNKTTNVDFSITSLNDIELYEEIVDEYILDKKTKEKILENIEFKTTIPIPSFKVKRIEQNDTTKRIEFVYNIRNLSRKLKFSDISQDNPLYVYGHFCNLEVTDHTNKGCVNLKITSKEDFINYCIAQYNEDINYRREFVENHPEYYDEVNYVTIEKANYDFPDFKFVTKIHKDFDNKITLIVAY